MTWMVCALLLTALWSGSVLAKPVEIVFWNPLGGALAEAVEKLVDEFNASQDEIRVINQYQGPSYAANQQKLQVGMVAGSVPDVTMIEVSALRQFAESGALVDLSAMMEKHGVDGDDFIEGLLIDGTVDGRVYALPFNRSTPLLYYNKTLFEEYGLDPEGPKTWDDLRHAAQVLTVRGATGVERYGIKMPVHAWLFEGMVAQAGGSVLNDEGTEVTVNSPAGIKALTLWTDMILEDGTQAISIGWPPARADFVNGKAAMIFESTANLSVLLNEIAGRFELGVAYAPRDEVYAVATDGASLVIPIGSKHHDAAFKFVEYMTSTLTNAAFSKDTGYLPVRHSVVADLADFWADNPLYRVAVDQLEFAIARPNSPSFPEISDLLVRTMERAVQGELTPEEALNHVKQAGDRILSR